MDSREFDRKFIAQKGGPIAGIDEAGRGPLAGPVVAAACVLPEGHTILGLNDSKKLSPVQRSALFQKLTTTPGIVYAIGISDHHLIDQINILEATKRAMIDAVNALSFAPVYLLVDGLKLPYEKIPGEKVIKGDSLSESIGAASILAKVTRDHLMVEYDAMWPEYGFAKHKGYGTQSHRQAIQELGPCPIHRTTFEPVKSWLLSQKRKTVTY